MLLIVVLIACLASLATTMPAAPPSPRYFITFGDSYSQTGFNITSTKPFAGNPIGNPALPGYTASGGYNWVGYMVTQFNNSLLLSYNFAYGGATTDASLVTPYEPTVLSFVDQVDEFTEYLAAKPSWAPWTSEDTLVGVWMGVNDVGNAFYEANGTAVIAAVVERYFELLQTLYNGGIRNFVLLSVPPTNETPLMLANDATSEAELEAAIKQYEQPFYKAIDDPEKYGAPNATCYNSDGTSCLWFNDYHPGIAINKLVAEAVAETVGKPWFKV